MAEGEGENDSGVEKKTLAVEESAPAAAAAAVARPAVRSSLSMSLSLLLERFRDERVGGARVQNNEAMNE